MSVRVLAVVQARVGSTRLPGKALLSIAGKPMVAHVLQRVQAIRAVDQVVLATTVRSEDDELADFARSVGIACVRGSVDDVLDRFRAAVTSYPTDVVVRGTADCPLLDPRVSARVLRKYLRLSGRVDYVSNVRPLTYPDGLDTEVFSSQALERACHLATRPSDREHVTTYMLDHPEEFTRSKVKHRPNLSAKRWTVDTKEDLEFVRAVYGALSPRGDRIFGMTEVLELLRQRPDLEMINAHIRRNEGLELSRARDPRHDG